MEKRTKREIRWIVSGISEPRKGYGAVQNSIRKVVAACFVMDMIGFGLLILLAAPIAIPLWCVGGLIAGGGGNIAGGLVGVVVFLIWVFRGTWNATQIEMEAKSCGYLLCIWCHHPLTSLGTSGVCPECGKGFCNANTEKLMRQIFDPPKFSPAKKTVRKRSARLWARAIRERDRTREAR